MFMHDEDESDVLSTIKKLMEELAGKMEYSSDDFEERLGRKKPDVSVSVIKGDLPDEEMEEVAEVPEFEEEDEDDSLKDRLMRLRRG